MDGAVDLGARLTDLWAGPFPTADHITLFCARCGERSAAAAPDERCTRCDAPRIAPAIEVERGARRTRRTSLWISLAFVPLAAIVAFCGVVVGYGASTASGRESIL